MRGRKPKTVERQIAEGDPRKHGVGKLQQKLNAQPKAARGLPGCPDRLQGLAREQWMFWTEELEGMGIDKRPDAAMLEGACWNFAAAIDAEKILAREGQTVTESTLDDESGEVTVLKVKAHPAVTIARQRWTLVKGFCAEFGLSPVSRTRLTIEKKDDAEADLMTLLSGPRTARTEAVN